MTDRCRFAFHSTLAILVAAFSLAACHSPTTPKSGEPSATASTPVYEARIRRTSFGIPHIEAKDPASLAFGEGYAQAEDHLCTIADQVVKVRGERARYFGPGPENAHVANDATMKSLDLHQRAADDLAASGLLPMWEGFVAGYNQFLEQTGVDQVPGWCRGAEWVQPITAQDIAAVQRSFIILLPRLAGMIASASPPDPQAASQEPDLEKLLASTSELSAELRRHGSNGWALGSEWTEGGQAMLVANPHYPWIGAYRFWEKHLQIPGALDAYGVGLIGVPGVAIGFNEHVGWTHTVSAGKRLTFYALQLVPGQPTQYVYDGEVKNLESRDIEISVRQEDGRIATQTITTWSSLHGPVLNFPNVGWTPKTVIAVRDANFDNNEAAPQWMAMGQAQGMDELQALHLEYQGMPWVNTIAASSDGRAWYTDSAATPNLSDQAIASWLELTESDPLIGTFSQQGMVALPGNSALFAWQDDPGARDPGVVAGAAMPQLERRDYVFNANDSFWLANSAALIEGDYSPLHGRQRTIRSLRTRNNDLTLSRRSPDQPAGADGRFTREEMKAALMSNRSYAAELLKPDLLAACAEQPSVTLEDETVDLAQACDVLAAWDDRFDVDSRGAVLFREWIGQYPVSVFYGSGELYRESFNADDPVNTPAGLADSERALQNLARAVRLLESAGHALDVPLGELQYAVTKLPERIGVPGGEGGFEGVMNMQIRAGNSTTLEPLELPAVLEGSRRLTPQGYPIAHGSSFVLALEFTDEGPVADAVLSYGESGDPQSPHFTDQTRLFAQKQWRPVRFREPDIAADTQREYVIRR